MRALLIQHGCEAGGSKRSYRGDDYSGGLVKARDFVHDKVNKLYLTRKLYTFYMLAERKISEHIDEFNKIVLDLANIEEVLTLKDLMATLNSKKIKERSKAKRDDDE
ncbi:hypothetical protein Tco_1476356 [Tanacetum coccineum]